MSGCDNVSLIAQGIASVQLYMQRCRMMLEPGVNDLSNIPEPWWDWMSAYRIWEANRRIFLYPENYLDPALRREQTPPFKKFADSLLQTNIDDNTVSTAYKNYFADFSELAGLVNCASYSCNRYEEGNVINTLFVFGRTNKQPYTYYYRKFDNHSSWTAWQKMEITINSLLISPVFAFNKLFIFWAEIKEVENSKMEGNNSIPISSSTATIMFSFLNEQYTWEAPQELAGNIVINYKERYKLDTYVFEKYKDDFETNKTFWQMPFALYVEGNRIYSEDIYPTGDNIVVNYGFAVKMTVKDKTLRRER